jgi:hypothetical protein
MSLSECAGLQFPLVHEHLNAAFQTGFVPEPIPRTSPAGNIFRIQIQPRFNPKFGHAMSLEVSGDEFVGHVMSRALRAFHLSSLQEYALVFVKDLADPNEMLLDSRCTLSSYGIDAVCLGVLTSPTDGSELCSPALLLYSASELKVPSCSALVSESNKCLTFLS